MCAIVERAECNLTLDHFEERFRAAPVLFFVVQTGELAAAASTPAEVEEQLSGFTPNAHFSGC